MLWVLIHVCDAPQRIIGPDHPSTLSQDFSLLYSTCTATCSHPFSFLFQTDKILLAGILVEISSNPDRLMMASEPRTNPTTSHELWVLHAGCTQWISGSSSKTALNFIKCVGNVTPRGATLWAGTNAEPLSMRIYVNRSVYAPNGV